MLGVLFFRWRRVWKGGLGVGRAMVSIGFRGLFIWIRFREVIVFFY